MELYDLQGAVDMSGEKEIEAALKKRYGNGFNSFWFSPSGEKFPVMAILVAGEFASLHYFPEDRHPGFRSVGNIETLDPDEMTTFYMNNLTEEELVPNDTVVSFSDAVKAAREFAVSNALPTSIDWDEL